MTKAQEFIQAAVGEMTAIQARSNRGILVGGSLVEQLAEAKQRPRKRALFGPFWSEREVSFLYGGTGVGKSVLAMQIAAGIASGESMQYDCEVEAQPVLLLDFENDAEDLIDRVGDQDVQGIHRLNFNLDASFRQLADDMCTSIEKWVEHSGSKVVIIDNISWLLDSDDKRRDVSIAADLMKKLKALKDEFGLAILVIAHTPKSKYLEPLTTAHLFGSSMLGNFANSMFAIGANRAKGLLYLIQTKRRSGPIAYGADNVAVCKMDRNAAGMLQFFPQSCMPESDVLSIDQDANTAPNQKQQILQMMDEGRQNKDIEQAGFKPDYVKKVRREWKSKKA